MCRFPAGMGMTGVNEGYDAHSFRVTDVRPFSNATSQIGFTRCSPEAGAPLIAGALADPPCLSATVIHRLLD